ncbi:MAG: hypothetical protein LBL07_06870, partial [Tannerella sp.]|nr:hypothetical protein [Tannerella sp.]
MKQLLILVAVLLVAGCSNEIKVGSEKCRITLNAKGQITELKCAGTVRTVSSEALLEGAVTEGEVTVKELSGGGREFGRTVKSPDGHKASVTERFMIAGNGGISWTVEIAGLDGEAWSAPVCRTVKYPAGDDVQWWTAWSDPRCQHIKDKSWHDPLVPQPLKDATLNYGLKPLEDGKPFDLADSPPYWSDLSTLPMFTFLEKNTDFGLTFIQSPADNLLDVRMSITKDGKAVLEYLHHRFTGKPLVLTALLIPHQADWRAALKEVVDLYPDYFEPVNPKVNGIAGAASYSNATDAIVADAGKYRKMGYRVNWQASVDFPWFGMFIPPVDDEVHWTTFGNRDYCVPMFEKEARAMKEAGFFTLNYFNVTEVGTYIKYPRPQSVDVSEQDLWKDANAYLYSKLGDAILMLPDKKTGKMKPVFSWCGSVVTDPGVASYHDFLLAQLQRHIDKIPSSFGICIDRMDWLRLYNPAFDDGVSWYEGKPAQSLLSGWRR